MLKKIRVLFLGLMVLAGSACVTPTHASSADSVLITYIQAAGSSGAREELVVLHNNSGVAIDITDWCLGNKAGVKFACFTPPSLGTAQELRFILPAYSNATVASQEYGAARSLHFDVFSLMYVVTNQSSGSIINSADTITLIDANDEVRDAYAWLSAPASGKAFTRLLLLTLPDVYAATGTAADWFSAPWKSYPVNDIRTELRDVMPPENPDGEEEAEPEIPEPEFPSQPHPTSHLLINEILANASGADAGKEFIELFNSSDTQSVSLNGVRLRIGRDTPKWYALPSEVVIPPQAYVVFYDNEIGFSLVNTSGGVQLYYGDAPLGERIEYESPKDDMAWVLVNGVWQYSAAPTPGAQNDAVSQTDELDDTKSSASLKPCASNQFRNPETGRCKLLSSSSATQTPCKVGQERNPETNRCRTIAAAATPTPCKAGQERNPETNRCRNITKMSNAEHGVKGVQNMAGTQLSWYYWAGIIGVIVAILGYGAWEWREEVRSVWRRLKAPFAKR